jgi:organic hydroperoxide reductase OsmC/OhrA
MSERTHHYEIDLAWTGNNGSGTSSYRAYRRDHEIAATGKPPIAGSSDSMFQGDAARWNPEELLIASLSGCHMLWYLHLAADAAIVVTDYRDAPVGTLSESGTGGGRFVEVVLHPTVTIRSDDPQGPDTELAMILHRDAHTKCFIANSVNFPVRCQAQIRAG